LLSLEEANMADSLAAVSFRFFSAVSSSLLEGVDLDDMMTEFNGQSQR
jgi:hypothetical protein